MSEMTSSKEKKTILYICGAGHSGSTLLDILLGAQKNAFSAGELINLPQKGIKNGEYCSCGAPVPGCEVWSQVIDEWGKISSLDLEEYIQIQKTLTSIKKNILFFKILRKPSEKINLYLKDTRKLYDIIFDITSKNIIIDSSKSPYKILILKKLGFNIIVIHLTRRFGDVLNSNKKKAKKDLKAGIEHNITPRKTYYIFMNWLTINTLAYIFSRNVVYKKIKYEDLVKNPSGHIFTLTNIDLEFSNKLKRRGPFNPKHLVAGNKIRMQDNIYIADKPMNTSYHRLNKMDKFLAKCIDFFYE